METERSGGGGGGGGGGLYVCLCDDLELLGYYLISVFDCPLTYEVERQR